jgi:hypothetical protein
MDDLTPDQRRRALLEAIAASYGLRVEWHRDRVDLLDNGRVHCAIGLQFGLEDLDTDGEPRGFRRRVEDAIERASRV